MNEWLVVGQVYTSQEIKYKLVENGMLKKKFEPPTKYKRVKNGMPKWNLNKAKLQVDESIPTCPHLSKAKKKKKKKKEKERRQHPVNVKEEWINIVTTK